MFDLAAHLQPYSQSIIRIKPEVVSTCKPHFFEDFFQIGEVGPNEFRHLHIVVILVVVNLLIEPEFFLLLRVVHDLQTQHLQSFRSFLVEHLQEIGRALLPNAVHVPINLGHH